MARKKRKSSSRARRGRQQAQRRLLASSVTLFGGILLGLLAFVDGQAAWHTAHDILFGVFGAGSFVLGPAVCYMAVLAAREEPVAPCVVKLLLGLAFLSGARWSFPTSPPGAYGSPDGGGLLRQRGQTPGLAAGRWAACWAAACCCSAAGRRPT